MDQPGDREALVAPARQGSLRVLGAALDAGVERIVITSSMVAMMYRPDRPRIVHPAESDWSDPEWTAASAYIVSKIRAERAAWDLVDERGARDRLVVVNPGFVLGPLVDDRTGTSVDVIKLIIKGVYPAVPPSAYPIVDVRDLADLQVASMTAPVGGRRLMAAGETLTMADMARILRREFPGRAARIPTRELPGFAVRLLSYFDRSLRSILPDIGTRPEVDARYVTALTGVGFRAAGDSVRATGESLVARGLV